MSPFGAKTISHGLFNPSTTTSMFISPNAGVINETKAIAINQELSYPYYIRAKIHADMNNLEAALIDANLAIQFSPSNATYFLFRAQIHSLMGEANLSKTDDETAKSLSQGNLSSMHNTDLSLFSNLKPKTK